MRVAIVGAGMAGASLAYFLGRDADIVLLEAEDTPGYHTTGRSAAFWVPSYGGLTVLPLTSASRDFFMDPPEGFARPLLTPRGALHLATPGDDATLAATDAELSGAGLPIERLDAAALAERFPMLRPEWARRRAGRGRLLGHRRRRAACGLSVGSTPGWSEAGHRRPGRGPAPRRRRVAHRDEHGRLCGRYRRRCGGSLGGRARRACRSRATRHDAAAPHDRRACRRSRARPYATGYLRRRGQLLFQARRGPDVGQPA